MSIRGSFTLVRARYPIHALASLAITLSAIVLLADHTMFGTLLVTLIVALGLGAAIRWLVDRPRQTLVLGLVATALAIRVATAMGVYFASLALGKGGFLGVDDGVYAAAASMLVDYVRGEPEPANVPPYWAGHAYLMGPYVYLEAVVFFLFGPSPLPVLVMNAAAMCSTALLAGNVARRLFGDRPGIVTTALILFTPSLVVWSALNLKDSITIFLVAALVWVLYGFQQHPRWWMLAIVFLLALSLEGLRRWAFYLLLVIIPIAVLVSPRLRPFLRAASWASAAALVSVLMLSALGGNLPIGQINADVMENIRLAMAKGARTGYAYLPPEGVVANPGDTFVIVAPSPTPTEPVAPGSPPPTAAVGSPVPKAEPTPRPEPTLTPRTIVVAPGTRIVLETPTPRPTAATQPGETRAPAATPVPTPTPTRPVPPFSSPEPPTVIVRPGDVVIVSTSGVAPSTTEQPKPLALRPDVDSEQASESLRGTDALDRLIAYLPIGTVYALFAPFPWQVGRVADLGTIPDMLIWYAVLAAAIVSTWKARERWRDLSAFVLFALATLAVFAVAEGNTGTLFRHRAMTIPFAIVLASPVLAVAIPRVLSLLPQRGGVVRASSPLSAQR